MQVNVLAAYSAASTSYSPSLSQLAQAASTFRTFLDPLSSPLPLDQRKHIDVDNAYRVLQQHPRALDDQLQDYLDNLGNSFHLIRRDVDDALRNFDAAPTTSAKFDTILTLLHTLGTWIQRWQAPVQAVWPSSNTLALFRRTFLSHLHHSLPPSFSPSLSLFLSHLLTLPSPSILSTTHPHLPLALPTLLTLLDRFDPLLFGLIYEEIERRVERECSGSDKWGERKLEGLCRWLNGSGSASASGSVGGGKDGGVLGWVSGIYDAAAGEGGSATAAAAAAVMGNENGKGKGKSREGTPSATTAGGGGGGGTGASQAAEKAKKFLKPTFSRFEHHVHKVLGQLRSTEIYPLLLSYPSSTPALEDLKLCLSKSPSLPLLLRSLSSDLQSNLLHPGCDTPTIIAGYINVVRGLRVVDPAGVVLSRAAGEVRAYLRSRKDTIHHILLSLLSPSSSLALELRNTTSGPDALSKGKVLLVSEGRDDAENYGDPKWVPDPVEAPADFRKSKSADIIQLLVSIYDTKDVFVKELQVLLAQRLLVIKDYGLDEEMQNVSTLKLRFGEAALQGCDVMIKDLQDSQKLDEAVHEKLPDIPLHATIVSRLFWPSFQAAPLRLPGQIGRAQASYLRTFSSLKPDKKLRFLPQLGTVNLSLTMEDGREITVDATPVQAGVVELFGRRDTWSTTDLASTLKLPDPSTARNALYFWSNLGIVRQLSTSELSSLPVTSPQYTDADGDIWRLIEDEKAGGAPGVDGHGGAEGGGVEEQHIVEEEVQAVQSVEEERLEEMRVFWQFVQGMLTNLGALPLSRIHTTLNMLAPGYKGRTTDELTALLESVEREGRVTRTGKGDWKIVK